MTLHQNNGAQRIDSGHLFHADVQRSFFTTTLHPAMAILVISICQQALNFVKSKPKVRLFWPEMVLPD